MKKILLTASLMLASVSGFAQLPKDPVSYPVAEGYQIESLWMQCDKLGNKPADLAGSNSRGMAVLNGKIYVTLRKAVTVDEKTTNNGYLLIYDANTGDFIKELALSGDGISETGIMTTNDIQVDDAGNLLVCSLSTNLSSENDPFSVWIVNPETGVARSILKYTNLLDVKYRIDCFGVYGDITKNGYLLAAISKDKSVGGNMVLRWNFENGAFKPENENGEAFYIEIKEYANGSSVDLGNSDAPRVTPIDDNLFYLDPQTGWATLYDMKGTLIEGFNKESLKEFQPENGGGNNGVDEFTLNGEDFIVYVISNTANTSYPQAWNVCKLGAGPSFDGMKKIARIPDGGMGANSNAVRTALPRIEVKNNTAYIYLFATNAGLAAYKMAAVAEGLDKSLEESLVAVVNGRIELKESATIDIYTAAGQRVVSAVNSISMDLPKVSGMYIIKATFKNKKQIVLKALVD